jgi:iron complex outermembrane receptor protein
MAIDPAGYVFVERALHNDVKGDFRGAEVSVDWKPVEKWRLQGAYSYININNAVPGDSLPMDIGKNVPVRMYSLFSTLELNRHLNWSVWFKHTGAIEVGNLPAYDIADSSLSWRAGRNVNLTLVGQNLFDKVHQEFSPRFVFSNPREFGRRFYLKSEWNF